MSGRNGRLTPNLLLTKSPETAAPLERAFASHVRDVNGDLDLIDAAVAALAAGGGGGAPSGPAGGDLTGTYPNPQIAAGAITDLDVAAANKDGAAATPSLRTLGTGAQQAAAGNDARLTNARTPTAHASTHQPGGSDAMAVDQAAATGSLRTLGTGAAQAAAGNHAHAAATAPAARAYHSGAQALSSGVALTLAFDSERFDTDAMHDPVTNNSRLTCKTAGVYLVSATVRFQTGAGAYRQVTFLLNGATNIGGTITPAVSGNVTIVSVISVYQLAVNDYVEVRAVADAAINVESVAQQSPEFAAARIG